MKHPLLFAALTSLAACASVFDAQPDATSTPAASAVTPAPTYAPPPPPPPAIPINTPYPVAVAAVPAPAPPAMSAGPVHAAQPSLLRARPQAQATVEAYIPAGATLTLRVRQDNRDGAWWFTEYQGKTGWVSELGLTP